ncbi:MAG TPA: DnaJ domain-containing protein [Acidobacteriota bacterium]
MKAGSQFLIALRLLNTVPVGARLTIISKHDQLQLFCKGHQIQFIETTSLFPGSFLNKIGMSEAFTKFQAATEMNSKIEALRPITSDEAQIKTFIDEVRQLLAQFFKIEINTCRLKLENFNDSPALINFTQLFYEYGAPFAQSISLDELLPHPQIPFKRSADFMNRTNRVRISAVEGYLLSRLEQPHTLAQILSMVPGDEQSTRRALLTLWAFGLVDSQVLDQLVPKVEAPKIETAKTESVVKETPAAETPKVEAAKEKPKAKPQVDQKSARGESLSDLKQLIEQAYYGLNRQDYYSVLGVTPRADLADIKTAYYALARKFHPDRFYGMEDNILKEKVDVIFATINGAYETLKSAKKRSDYDSSSSDLRAISVGPLSSESKSAEPLGRDAQLKAAEEHSKKAQAAYDKGNNYEAVQYLKAATQIAPEVAKYWQQLGVSLSRNPQWRKEAEESFNKATELDPKNPENHLYMGFLFKNAGLKLRARKHFASCLQMDPKNEIAKRELAAIDGAPEPEGSQPKKSGMLGGIFKQKK